MVRWEGWRGLWPCPKRILHPQRGHPSFSRIMMRRGLQRKQARMPVLPGFLFRRGVLLVEAFDAAGGVNQLLLAGEEGMAVRADFELQDVAFVRGARLEDVAAGAGHGHFVVVGMNAGFHAGCSSRPAGLRGSLIGSVRAGAYSRVARPRTKLQLYSKDGIGSTACS